MATRYFEQILKTTTYETRVVWPLTAHLKNGQSKMKKTCYSPGEVVSNFICDIFYRPLQMDLPVLADELESIHIISMRTQNVVWKTCLERWIIGTERERERERERVRKIRTICST